jgi:excisionase family DNA binding protein
MNYKPNYNLSTKDYNKRVVGGNHSPKLFKNLINDEIEDEKVRWFDTDEAANFLRITPNALRILVHRARVKSYKLGRRLRFKQCDLVSVLQLKEDY